MSFVCMCEEFIKLNLFAEGQAYPPKTRKQESRKARKLSQATLFSEAQFWLVYTYKFFEIES